MGVLRQWCQILVEDQAPNDNRSRYLCVGENVACNLFTLEAMIKARAFAAIAVIAIAWPVHADEIPPPVPPPGLVPMYPAPLSQQTQPTYVPQSVAMSGPEEITDIEEGRPPPPGYTAVQRTRKGLIIGGGVTFGATYGVSALTAAIGHDISDSGRNEVAAMWIPVVGPFIQISRTDSAVANVLLAGIGGAQVAGAVMLYYGLTTKKRVFVRNDLVGNMTVVPLAGNGATGLGLSGRF